MCCTVAGSGRNISARTPFRLARHLRRACHLTIFNRALRHGFINLWRHNMKRLSFRSITRILSIGLVGIAATLPNYAAAAETGLRGTLRSLFRLAREVPLMGWHAPWGSACPNHWANRWL